MTYIYPHPTPGALPPCLVFPQCGRKLGRYATTLEEDELLLDDQLPLPWRHRCAVLARLDEKRLLRAVMPTLQAWKALLPQDPDAK